MVQMHVKICNLFSLFTIPESKLDGIRMAGGGLLSWGMVG
jgi:hypothetical protein